MERLAYSVAPAATAALFIADNDVGLAVVTFIAVLGCGRMIRRAELPLHVMPVGRVVARLLGPLLGVAIVWVTSWLLNFDPGAREMVTTAGAAALMVVFGSIVKRGFDAETPVPVAVVGDAFTAAQLAEELRTTGVQGWSVVGHVPTAPVPPGAEPGVLRNLGALEDIRQIVLDEGIELLVHALPTRAQVDEQGRTRSRLAVFEEIARACLDLRVRMVELNGFYEDVFGHTPVGTINAAWFQYVMHPRFDPGSPFARRAVDLLVGGLAGLVALPVIALAALAIKLEDRGPVFFRQRRVGEGGREFHMLKLRTMRASPTMPATWSGEDDPRITRVGRILRRTHLDELPQVIHVLTGRMTLVGPRPEQLDLVRELERELPYYQRRLLVKPGVTGWAQVSIGYAGSELGTAWKLCYDLYYLKRRSIFFDLMVLVETVRTLVADRQFGRETPQEGFLRSLVD